jgi:hypothetical protein
MTATNPELINRGSIEPMSITDKEVTLDQIRVLTEMIEDHQDAIAGHGRMRRDLIMQLRDENTTYRLIANAMNKTEQNVYKIVKHRGK